MKFDNEKKFLKVIIFLLLTAACVFHQASAQLVFATPQDAARTFIKAIQNQDKAAYNKILGSDWSKYIPTDGIDRDDVNKFLEAWDQAHSIRYDAEDLAYITVGLNQWALPIPMTKSDDGWRFNPEVGEEELQTRRIGRNELSAIQAVLAYYDAQKEYAEVDHNGDGSVEYAQRIISTPGTKDGLYWAALPGEEESPLGPVFGEDKTGHDYHGYYFKILKAQGARAKGGAYDYIIGNRMIGGFALIAWPAEYGETGVMSFIISHSGQIYESNLGPETDADARHMKYFDPNAAWERIKP